MKLTQLQKAQEQLSKTTNDEISKLELENNFYHNIFPIVIGGTCIIVGGVIIYEIVKNVLK
jgi:hypothetical protein